MRNPIPHQHKKSQPIPTVRSPSAAPALRRVFGSTRGREFRSRIRVSIVTRKVSTPTRLRPRQLQNLRLQRFRWVRLQRLQLLQLRLLRLCVFDFNFIASTPSSAPSPFSYTLCNSAVLTTSTALSPCAASTPFLAAPDTRGLRLTGQSNKSSTANTSDTRGLRLTGQSSKSLTTSTLSNASTLSSASTASTTSALSNASTASTTSTTSTAHRRRFRLLRLFRQSNNFGRFSNSRGLQ